MQSVAPFSYRTRRPTGRKEHGLRRFHTSAGKRLKKAFRTQSAGRRRKEARRPDFRQSRYPAQPTAIPAARPKRPRTNPAIPESMSGTERRTTGHEPGIRPEAAPFRHKKQASRKGMPDDTHRCCLTPRTQQPPAGPQGKITVRNRGPGLPVPRVLQVPEPDSPRN